MIIALLISVAINLLVAEGILSHPYVSLGLLVAAAGIAAAQIHGQTAQKKVRKQQSAPPDGNAQPGGKFVTVTWYVVILAWIASLVYAILVYKTLH